MESRDSRSSHCNRAKSKQRVRYQHARLRARIWRIPRGSTPPPTAGNARQSARSVDVALDDLEGRNPASLARLRCCDTDISAAASAAYRFQSGFSKLCDMPCPALVVNLIGRHSEAESRNLSVL